MKEGKSNFCFYKKLIYYLLELNNQNSPLMIIGIAVMSSFLILVIMIIMSIICCRSRRNRLKSNRNDKNVKPYV